MKDPITSQESCEIQPGIQDRVSL